MLGIVGLMVLHRVSVVLLLVAVTALPPAAEGADPAKDLRSKDVAVRLLAVDALKKDGGEQAEAMLLRALDDSDWEVTERAAEALATRGGPDAVKPLSNLALTGPVNRIRQVAARSVAAIDSEAAAKRWVGNLNGDAALHAIEALAAAAQVVGEKSGETLRKGIERALRAKEGPIRAVATTGLAALPAAERRDRLVRLFTEPDLVVAAAALSEAARAPDDAYLEPLAAQLARPEMDDVIERRVAAAIVAALALIPDEAPRTKRFNEVVAPVVRAKDALVAGRAARLVGALAYAPRPSAALTPDAAAAPSDPRLPPGGMDGAPNAPPVADPGVPAPPGTPPPVTPPPAVPPRRTLIGADAALAALEPAFAHKGPTARAMAAQALGRIPTSAALDVAARLVASDESPRVRDAALRVLVEGRGVTHEPTRLIVNARLAGDADASVREDAAVLLGVSGPDKSPYEAPVAALEKALDDPDWAVSVCAAVSLGKTRAPHAVAPLARMLDPKKVKDWRRRGAAVVGLGLVRVKAAVPFLVEALDDKDVSVKRTAFEFLRRLTTRTIAADRAGWESWWSHIQKDYEFIDNEKASREAKKGGYASTPVEVYDKLDVVVLQSRGDHIEQMLDKLGITYRLTRAAAVTAAELHPFAVFFSNCTGEVQAPDVERIAWFVRVGGYFFGSCWALHHTVELIYPGPVRKLATKAEVLDHVLAVPCTESPFFDGVFPAFTQPVFVLWGSHLIEVLEPERVEVLIDGPLSSAHWGGGNLACWFEAGHGVILDSANHFDHQGLEHVIGLKTADDRRAYAMDHMSIDYEEMRMLERLGVFTQQATAAKEVRDTSVFRFITNFVRQKRRADL